MTLSPKPLRKGSVEKLGDAMDVSSTRWGPQLYKLVYNEISGSLFQFLTGSVFQKRTKM